MSALELQSTQTLASKRTASGSRLVKADPLDRIGEVIAGKWLLQSTLGVGGAGSVYAAIHQNGKRVAIKVLHLEYLHDPDVKSRFLFEPNVTNRITHPGVVSIHDDGVTSDGAPFFVMDLLEGETLERRVEASGPLDIASALVIARQVLDILVASHSEGVVHLDIKPSNIFLSCTGQVYLLDFGVARVAHGPNWTQPGVAIGTPMFMAPEQATADWSRVDQRSDLWALGAVLRYALTGTYLRAGSTVEQVMIEAQTRPVTPASALGLPAPIAEFLDKALAFRPGQRFATALQMRHALQAVSARLLPRNTSGPAGRPTRRAPGRDHSPDSSAIVPLSVRAVQKAAESRRRRAWAVALLLPGVVGLAGFGQSYAAGIDRKLDAFLAQPTQPAPSTPPPKPPAPVPTPAPMPTPTPSPSPSPLPPERPVPSPPVPIPRSAVGEPITRPPTNNAEAVRSHLGRSVRSSPNASTQRSTASTRAEGPRLDLRGDAWNNTTSIAGARYGLGERRLPAAGLGTADETAADPLAERL